MSKIAVAPRDEIGSFSERTGLSGLAETISQAEALILSERLRSSAGFRIYAPRPEQQLSACWPVCSSS